MAQQYDNELSGMLANNSYKTEDKHPDRTGVIQIGGKQYKLAGWLKKNKDGETYLSLKATPADAFKGGKTTTPPERTRREPGSLDF